MIILHFHLPPQFKYELFHIYFTLFHSSREDMNSIDLAPNVWLHSSVGRASHRYRGVKLSWPVWLLVFLVYLQYTDSVKSSLRILHFKVTARNSEFYKVIYPTKCEWVTRMKHTWKTKMHSLGKRDVLFDVWRVTCDKQPVTYDMWQIAWHIWLVTC